MNDKDYTLYKETVKNEINDRISDEDLNNYIIRNIRPTIGNVPKSFYKYRKVSDNVISEIINGYTYLSKPSRFDDKFDSKFMISSENEGDESDKFLFRINGINIEEVTESFINHRNLIYDNKLRIGCFTQKNTNMPMWYYYADQYKGVCIKYDFSDLSILDNEGCIFLPVVYPKDNELDEYYLLTMTERNACAIRNALVKRKDWSFEKEWRIIKLSDENDGIELPVKIRAIYIGIDADTNIKNSVMSAVNQSGQRIEVYQMVMTHRGLKHKKIL